MRAGATVICVSHVGAGGLSLDHHLRLEEGRILSANDSGARRESSSSARRRGRDSRPR
jgi:hypothetical protein